jgi:methylated-DNA-[protein]-cysteine S-methyltransferase
MSARLGLIASPLGKIALTAEADNLTGLYFTDQKYLPDFTGLQRVSAASDTLFKRVHGQLDSYFAGDLTRFDLSLLPHGSSFNQRVWQILREIAYGDTTSYGAIAEALGNRHLAQRVGQAVGHNPISIIIPCHRVLGADGALTGYAGGLDRKRALLELEEPEEAQQNRLF